MLVRSITFRGHAVFGDLKIDLCDPKTGRAFPSVILAGENGTGKSLLLSEIYRSLGEVDLSTDTPVEVEVELSPVDLDLLRRKLDASEMSVATAVVRRGHVAPNSAANFEVSFTRVDGEVFSRSMQEVFGGKARPMRAFLSEAGGGLGSAPPRTFAATTVDGGVESRRGGDELHREIAQLLLDIQMSDSLDIAAIVRSNPGAVVPADDVDRRIKRFREALGRIFPNKRLGAMIPVSGGYDIQFTESGRASSLAHLSGGERQVLARAGLLLRDQSSATGAVLLFDEPELGLHPRWQALILGFLRELLLPIPGATTQIIAATHSPFLVHGKAKDTKVVVLRKDPRSGTISVDQEPQYPMLGRDRVVNALRAGPLMRPTTKRVVLFVEGESDAQIIEVAWEKLHEEEMPFDVQVAYGAPQIRVRLHREELYKNHRDKTFVGLFDFDKGFAEWSRMWERDYFRAQEDGTKGFAKGRCKGRGFAMLLPIPGFRSAVASLDLAGKSSLCIELMFEDDDHPPGLVCLETVDGIERLTVNPALKRTFAEHVITMAAESFLAFGPLFEGIRALEAATSGQRGTGGGSEGGSVGEKRP